MLISQLLHLGITGALLYCLSIISLRYLAVKEYAQKMDSESFYTITLIIYAVLFGLVESQFLNPSNYPAFIISVALLNVCVIKENKSNYQI